ncbi:hypothetical protein H310_13042 [Aphanomyces invadans]|uniref:C3H1-type domain-containing protein n=1 Tax=Aphanomyces invadans TaxID=157072 RepID=A0A024TGZ5_9STRA|nr:hypothetical protein H310_13042 [Aphanomyces invadans]ETV92851.1 hypothetical protein H310_13042 [Aphanomyces invadans]|eukprot:XP_008878621.1 hypothetical protein H310_13042 [Aphanomyces invadans]
MSGSQAAMQVLANGDIIDCGRLPNSARNTLYKTELCKHFVETGTCRYGTKCQFAHGEDELRGVLRHPKYKTTKCKAFLSTGKCTYGTRCRFIHDRYPSPEEEGSDDEDSMTRAEQDHLNMKSSGGRLARVNPRRMGSLVFEPEIEASSLKLQPPYHTGLVADGVKAKPRDGPSDDDRGNQADDVGTSAAFSRLSIFQKICRAAD